MDPRENKRGVWSGLSTPRPGKTMWAPRLGQVISGGGEDEQRVESVSRAPAMACTLQLGNTMLHAVLRED